MTLAAWCSALVIAAAAEVAPPPPPPPGAPPAAASAAPATPAVAPTLPPAPTGSPATTAVTPVKDPRALALLQRMSDQLKGARSFSVKLRTTVEIPTGGVVSTYYNEGSLELARPDRVAASRQGDLPEFHFAYDGKTMTVSVPGAGQWATAAAPPTIAAMLGAAGEQGGLSFPADELLVDDPYLELTRELVHAVVIGQAVIGGRKVDHLALVTGGLELQYWLDTTTSLPAREAIVYADHPLRPHFSVDFSSWKLNQRVKDRSFALPMPKGATQVDFRAAAAAFR
jgi:hypothetical protein